MAYSEIENPVHYCEGREYEPKDVIRDWGLNFNLGSAVKYIARAGRKGNKIKDLMKARQYIAFEIAALADESESEKTLGGETEKLRKEVQNLKEELSVIKTEKEVYEEAISKMMSREAVSG